MRVLADLADQRAAIGVGHPVVRLDAVLGVDARLEARFELRLGVGRLRIRRLCCVQCLGVHGGEYGAARGGVEGRAAGWCPPPGVAGLCCAVDRQHDRPAVGATLHGGAIRPLPLLLIKPGRTVAKGQGAPRKREAVDGQVGADEIEPACDPAEEDLIGMLLQPKRPDDFVYEPDGAAQLPSCRCQNEQVVHAGMVNSPVSFVRRSRSARKRAPISVRNGPPNDRNGRTLSIPWVGYTNVEKCNKPRRHRRLDNQ